MIVSKHATHKGLRTPRTLTEAFGPTATYSGLLRESISARVDRLIGRFCAAVVVGTIALISLGMLS